MITISKLQQSEAIKIADDWKYDGEYSYYDMTEDVEDYEEIITPKLTGKKNGSSFLQEILSFVQKNYQYQWIRLSVAAFNQRAMIVYERAVHIL